MQVVLLLLMCSTVREVRIFQVETELVISCYIHISQISLTNKEGKLNSVPGLDFKT